MAACKSLLRTSISSMASTLRSSRRPTLSSPHNSPTLCFSPSISSHQGLRAVQTRVSSRSHASFEAASILMEAIDSLDDDNVEHLLTHKDDVVGLMKMERRRIDIAGEQRTGRWFPYLDRFKCGDEAYLSSGEVVEALEPHIMESRKERFRNVVPNRSYSVCLVVEGLRKRFGNVSVRGRSRVSVCSCRLLRQLQKVQRHLRYRENRHVSMGAEKWLDIELWDSVQDCFKALKSRGYRIATTHVGMDAVSIYDMDWSYPTAIVVGNESRGISDEALGLSDLHCSIPMNGMVDSFNVSVAAGILMHHAVCDRTSRLGSHGDLTVEERQILLAEFLLRHSESSISIANEFAKRKIALPTPKL